MIRVLRLREQDPVVWQKALLLSEAEEVSLQSSSAPDLPCSRDRYRAVSVPLTTDLGAEFMSSTCSAYAFEQVHDLC